MKRFISCVALSALVCLAPAHAKEFDPVTVPPSVVVVTKSVPKTKLHDIAVASALDRGWNITANTDDSLTLEYKGFTARVTWADKEYRIVQTGGKKSCQGWLKGLANVIQKNLALQP